MPISTWFVENHLSSFIVRYAAVLIQVSTWPIWIMFLCQGSKKIQPELHSNLKCIHQNDSNPMEENMTLSLLCFLCGNIKRIKWNKKMLIFLARNMGKDKNIHFILRFTPHFTFWTQRSLFWESLVYSIPKQTLLQGFHFKNDSYKVSGEKRVLLILYQE